MSEQPRQQIQLNAVQLLQITSEVLGQLKDWIEKKHPDDRTHSEVDANAARSLHHARLLTNLRLREIMIEVQKKQEAERQKTLNQFPPQSQLNHSAARVLGQNTTAKTIDELWAQAGLSHYIDTGLP